MSIRNIFWIIEKCLIHQFGGQTAYSQVPVIGRETCLTNTDFFVPRGVVIRKDENQIIMENPGYIRTGKDQMLKGGISDPGNKALMKMFNIIGIGERAGSGGRIFLMYGNRKAGNPR